MKSAFNLFIVFLLSVMITACQETEKPMQSAIDVSAMVEVLSSGRNVFVPDLSSVDSALESGTYVSSEDAYTQDYYCNPARTTTDNGDGTFTEFYAYYDYDYDYYEVAYEMLYNGFDDDDDGEIDEDDEILLMVTEEMSDGIDNNNNGRIDEFFEMTPTYYITYVIRYNEGSVMTTDEDGVVTTSGSFFYEWTEVKAPYNGQIVELSGCYFIDPETGEYTEETEG